MGIYNNDIHFSEAGCIKNRIPLNINIQKDKEMVRHLEDIASVPQNQVILSYISPELPQ